VVSFGLPERDSYFAKFEFSKRDNKMKYRKFGKLDWQVSALGFGCMRLPTIGGDSGNIDQERTNEMIRHAIDAGVNYIDTAYPYHEQTSEIALGKALEDGYRQRVCIATKSPIWLFNKPTDFDTFLDVQLRRLQTDMIDFYLFHALDRIRWKKTIELGLLQRAETALADGRIRYLGFSFHDSLDVFKRIVDSYDGWTFCQIQYNYMDTNFQAGTEGLHYAASKGLGVVVMEGLRGGRLAKVFPSVESIWSSATERNPADWAFQWLWNQHEVSVVLSGMNTLEIVEENLESANRSMPGSFNTDDLELINRVREKMECLNPIPCTSCEYCLPCPNGVNIPLNFEIYNRVSTYDEVKKSKFEYENWTPDDEKADCCIQCDEMPPKVPPKHPD
jgi:predicted aldo/keto reductase-like oxidoreductase